MLINYHLMKITLSYVTRSNILRTMPVANRLDPEQEQMENVPEIAITSHEDDSDDTKAETEKPKPVLR